MKSVALILIACLLAGCVSTTRTPVSVRATGAGGAVGLDVGEVIEYIERVGLDWKLTGAMILGIAAGAAGYWAYDEATDSGPKEAKEPQAIYNGDFYISYRE